MRGSTSEVHMDRQELLLTKAREMWTAKTGIATICQRLRAEYEATREEMEQAVADMLRGK